MLIQERLDLDFVIGLLIVLCFSLSITALCSLLQHLTTSVSAVMTPVKSFLKVVDKAVKGVLSNNEELVSLS
jgi:uncharacterized protein YoxC